MKNLYVLKFGGSSLATPEQITAVAKKIKSLYNEGKKMIVVTSAMGKTTDQLYELAKKISTRPNRRELDMLLTTGERVSMSLMSIALHELGCPSISFTGSQAGIMTDGSFTNAKITELKPIRVASALEENRVVIIAGFQGVDPATKEITTLGRGGSDTTAVALAAHFHAERCDILKDVDGVCTADPKIVSQAQIISEITTAQLYELCFWGAKVLNYRSAEFAHAHQVPLGVGRSDQFVIGTKVIPPETKNAFLSHQTELIHHAQKLELKTNKQFLAINSHALVLQLSVSCINSDEGVTKLKNILQSNGLPLPQVLHSVWAAGVLVMYLAVDNNDFHEIEIALGYSTAVKILVKNISTITVSYTNAASQTLVVDREEREAGIKTLFAKLNR